MEGEVRAEASPGCTYPEQPSRFLKEVAHPVMLPASNLPLWPFLPPAPAPSPPCTGAASEPRACWPKAAQNLPLTQRTLRLDLYSLAPRVRRTSRGYSGGRRLWEGVHGLAPQAKEHFAALTLSHAACGSQQRRSLQLRRFVSR